MNTLQNCSEAIVSLQKLENYLLDVNHKDGRSKAKFFGKFGYTISNSLELQDALKKLACQGNVVKVEFSAPHGTRVTVEGRLTTPDNRNPKVKIGWFFDSGDDKQIPRLVTVIPNKK